MRVALEGMHRSGKGTQLALLKDWFETQKLEPVIVRGAACRSGKGVENTDYYDPYSEYWRKFSKDRLTRSEDWSQAFSTINEELYEFDLLFGNRVMLMDRCYLSNEFFSERFTGMNVERPFLPDVVYFLRVDRDTLLERLNGERNWKAEFRRNNILQYFDEYEEFMEESFESGRVVEVDGSLEVGEILKSIKEDISGRLGLVLRDNTISL